MSANISKKNLQRYGVSDSIIAKGFNNLEFKEFLVGMESEYTDLLQYSKLRYLKKMQYFINLNYSLIFINK